MENDRTLKDQLKSLLIAATTSSGHTYKQEIISAFNSPPDVTSRLLNEVIEECGYRVKYDKVWRF
jgi:hypothetical protein